MRILYHHRVGSRDGQYVHIEEMVNAFRGLGHDVYVLGPKIVSVEKYGDESRLVAILKKTVPAFVYEFAELLYSFIDYFSLWRAVRKFKPDLVYERYNLYFISGVLFKKIFGIPLFLEINSPLFEERSRYGNLKNKWLARRIEKFTWANANHVFCVTNVLARKVVAAGVRSSCITITPNGINPENFKLDKSIQYYKEKNGLNNKIVLGFVGFVREWHGLDRVLELFSTYKSENYHLLIVGDGPACNDLRTQAKEHGLEMQLTITGPVERDSIKEYIAVFDVALQPNVVDYASPLKLFEYMVMGKAIVAPDQENIREILSHEYNGLLFNKDDSAGLSNAIYRLLKDEALRVQLGRNAEKTILDKKLTWLNNSEVVTEKYYRLLNHDNCVRN